jgi:hypothetical protein
MYFKGLRAARLMAGAAAALVLAGQAQALTINLIDNGGVTGSASEAGFRAAAHFWESVLTNNVTVNLGVGYSALGTGIIGSTSSTKYSAAVEDVISLLNDGRSSALDKQVVLPTLSTTTYHDALFGDIHGISMIRNGTNLNAQGVPTANGININTSQYDTSITLNNARIIGTEANLKAIGFDFTGINNHDADVTFSSAFNFDFDPTNGITAGYMDFIGVAIHEIGHALGFTSGVDTYDYYAGPNGPGRTTGNAVNWNNQTVGNVLDLFRYSNDPRNVVPGTGPALDWSIGTASYFSTDGGLTQFGGNALFATGAYNGDGRQASHFKDTPSPAGCYGANQIGIMDPTFCYGEMGVIKANDLAAMDTIGWNVNFDVLRHSNYSYTTAQYMLGVSGVPETSSWALMVLGFGAVGFAARRKAKVSFA